MARRRVYQAMAGSAQNVSRHKAASGRTMEKSRIVSAFLLLAYVCSAEDFHPITHRRIAGVMGTAGADWLVRPEREAEEEPDRALDLIGIAKGSTVADVGA